MMRIVDITIKELNSLKAPGNNFVTCQLLKILHTNRNILKINHLIHAASRALNTFLKYGI